MPTVLVVEDDWLFRTALREELELAGYGVIEARDCASARAQLDAAQEIDCAVFDDHLPDGTPCCLLEEIRTVRLECPAILLTAHRTDEGREEAAALGAYRYMDKPDHLSDVVRAVNEALLETGISP